MQQTAFRTGVVAGMETGFRHGVQAAMRAQQLSGQRRRRSRSRSHRRRWRDEGRRRGFDRPWEGIDRFGRQKVLRTFSFNSGGPSAAAEPAAAAGPSAAAELLAAAQPGPKLIECKQEPEDDPPLRIFVKRETDHDGAQ
eukprot:1392453-Karenia_brevis.AAC.1